MPDADADAPATLVSLGLRTEAWMVERVDALPDGAVRFSCPREPIYRWGNLLVVPEAPGPDDLPELEARFDRAFAHLPAVRHRTLTWDDPAGREGAVSAWSAAGYRPDRNTVRILTPNDLRDPPKTPAGFALKRVADDADRRVAADLSAAEPGDEDPDAFRTLQRGRSEFFRARERSAPDLAGGWFLATVDGEPVGTLGLYVRGRLGRYQQVFVAPEHRRAGVASSMVHAAARHGFDEIGAERIVIVAEEGSAADGLYARLGFRAAERWVGVALSDRDARRGRTDPITAR